MLSQTHVRIFYFLIYETGWCVRVEMIPESSADGFCDRRSHTRSQSMSRFHYKQSRQQGKSSTQTVNISSVLPAGGTVCVRVRKGVLFAFVNTCGFSVESLRRSATQFASGETAFESMLIAIGWQYGLSASRFANRSSSHNVDLFAPTLSRFEP